MFLSTVEVLLLVVYFFNPIFIESSSVRYLGNQSIVLVQIFDYMEDLWLHVLNRTDQKRVVFSQNRV